MGVREEHERMVDDAIQMRELRRGDKKTFTKRDGTEMVVITSREYDRFTTNENFLECLDAAGVDNWSGYGDACQMFREEEEDDE